MNRITDALDLIFDPSFFSKTKNGILVKKEKEVRFFSTNDSPIIIGITRTNATTAIEFFLNRDYIVRPAQKKYLVFKLLQNDVVNFYLIESNEEKSSEIYTAIVTISWVYY
jgi:hypothetical protein